MESSGRKLMCRLQADFVDNLVAEHEFSVFETVSRSAIIPFESDFRHGMQTPALATHQKTFFVFLFLVIVKLGHVARVANGHLDRLVVQLSVAVTVPTIWTI